MWKSLWKTSFKLTFVEYFKNGYRLLRPNFTGFTKKECQVCSINLSTVHKYYLIFLALPSIFLFYFF